MTIYKNIGTTIWSSGWNVLSFGIEIEASQYYKGICIDVGPWEWMLGWNKYGWKKNAKI